MDVFSLCLSVKFITFYSQLKFEQIASLILYNSHVIGWSLENLILIGQKFKCPS